MIFSLNDLSEIKAYKRKLLQRIEKVKSDFINEVGYNLSIYTPVRTGTLLNGMKIDKINFSISNDVPYAYYVEYGTRYFPGRYMMTQSYNNALTKLNIIVKNASIL